MGGRRIAIVGVPSSAGARSLGHEQAPGALRRAGLIGRLTAAGVDVEDHGDLAAVAFRPDPDHPREQNRELVCQVVRSVAAEVRRVAKNGAMPLVLGGDCTITIGVLGGLVGKTADLGLMYFDGDLDLNTPSTTVSGIFDGMVAAHILGQGSPELARSGPHCPLVSEPNLCFFGYNLGVGGIEPPELAALDRSVALRYPLDRVRQHPEATARQALAELESRVGGVLVHFDVDVTDLPAVDVPHPEGLPLDDAPAALRTFLGSPLCAGLVVTEFNPTHDSDGALARRLVDCLVDGLQA